VSAVRHFAPARGTGPDDVRAAFAGDPAWVADPPETFRRSYLDSFDWRACDAGGIVEWSDAGGSPAVTWRDLATGGVEARVPCVHPPRRPDELPEGRLRSRLEKVIGVRVLLPQATVEVRREQFRRRDDERKTIARVALEELRPLAGDDTPHHWRVVREEVRGYRGAARKADALIEHIGLERSRTSAALTDLLLAGCDAGGYTSKLRLRLDPAMPAADAYRVVLAHLLDTIERNRDGIVDDIDTEFLHDLRVAVRRTRSVLATADGVLPKHTVERFARHFRTMQQVTGRMRDLDVWLLNFDDIASLLDAPSRSKLEPLRKLIERERDVEHHRLAEALHSPDYEHLVHAWATALAAGPPPVDADLPDAERAISAVAAERVRHATRRVVRRGREITEVSPAIDLHELRKRAKRLRYLLECFRSTLPEEGVEALVPRLKKLQNLLGDHQDCSVQIADLRAFADDMWLAENPDTLLAMGQLATRVADHQADLRRHFPERYRAFAKAATRHPIGAS
jgi:CHAD domain-containing protein